MDNRKTAIEKWLAALLAVLLLPAALCAAEGGLYSSMFALPEGLTQSVTIPTAGAVPRPESCSFAKTSSGGISFSEDVILRGAFDLDTCRAIQVWGDYYASGGKIRPDGTDLELDQNFDGWMLGGTVGLGSALSLMGYYNQQTHKIAYNSATNKAKARLGGLGGRFNVAGFYFTLLGCYSDDLYTLEEDGGENRSLDYDGWQATGLFESGYEWPTEQGLFVLTPFSSIQYSTLKHDAIDRGAFTKSDDSVEYTALYQTLGSRIDLNCIPMLGLQGRLGWIHQYKADCPISNYQFSRVPGTITPTMAYDIGTGGINWFWCGIGGKLSFLKVASVTLDYDVTMNQHQVTHIGSVGVLVGF